DSSNYRKRVLHKIAEEVGLPKLTFQIIRRTIATLAKDKGHVKDIQGMMRHSRLATTTEVYMQSLASGVRSTVDSIHHELRGNGTRGKGPTSPTNLRAKTGAAESKNANAVTREAQNGSLEKGATTQRDRGMVLEFATKM